MYPSKLIILKCIQFLLFYNYYECCCHWCRYFLWWYWFLLAIMLLFFMLFCRIFMKIYLRSWVSMERLKAWTSVTIWLTIWYSFADIHSLFFWFSFFWPNKWNWLYHMSVNRWVMYMFSLERKNMLQMHFEIWMEGFMQVILPLSLCPPNEHTQKRRKMIII